MKLQTMFLAMSATSAVIACPVKQAHTSASGTSGNAAPAAATASSLSSSSLSKSSSTSAAPAAATASSLSSSSLSKSSSTSAAPAAATASSLSSSSNSKSYSSSAVSGMSTFYGGNLSGGSCSFTTMSTIPSGLYGTAYSGSAWDSAAECGACLQVTGPNGNSITVMVVDQCPECDEGHLDLFEDAFEQLGSKSAGDISTSYTQVPCGISSPIVLHNKSGTSAYWFSMQVVNSNEPVSKLEVSTDGGSSWQSTTRSEYNFFENSSGFGTDTVDVRVTSASGGSVTVTGVSVASDSQATASSNFS